MDSSTPHFAERQSGAVSTAQLAKATLRRLVLEKLEPTPENYARAYALEQGGPKPASLPEAALPLVRRLAERALGCEPQARANNVVQALVDGQWDRAQALLSNADGTAQPLAALVSASIRSNCGRRRLWRIRPCCRYRVGARASTAANAGVSAARKQISRTVGNSICNPPNHARMKL